MKQAKWLLLLAVGILMVLPGCKKLGDQVDVAYTETSPLVKSIWAGVGTGDTLTSGYKVGHIYMWEDATNLYIKYAMDELDASGYHWWLYECQADVAINYAGLPQNGQGKLIPGQFTYKWEPSPVQYVAEYTFTIPIGDWQTGTTIAVGAHCSVRPPDANGDPDLARTETGWGGDLVQLGSGWGFWFEYTYGEPTPGEWHEETSWAGNASNWKLWQFSGKNWALYLKYENPDPYQHYDLVGAMYVGNPKNGAHTGGTVTVSRDTIDGNEYLSVTYDTDGDWDLYECHVHVATSLEGIPQNKGNPPPGQFTYNSGAFDPYEDSYTFLVPYDPTWGNGPIYVAAHSVVGTYNWPLW